MGAGNFGADLFFRSFVCEFLVEGETYGLDGNVGTSGGLEEGADGLIVSKCCKLGQQDPGRRPRRGEELTGEFWLVRIHRHRCWVRLVCELFFFCKKKERRKEKRKVGDKRDHEIRLKLIQNLWRCVLAELVDLE